LQHLIQCERNATPSYRILSTTETLLGTFVEVGIFVEGELVSKGEGDSMKGAAKQAAKKAIEWYLEYDHYFEPNKELQN
jgi:dsRNA-specific ribonuclease